jgi:hypothetical protein
VEKGPGAFLLVNSSAVFIIGVAQASRFRENACLLNESQARCVGCEMYLMLTSDPPECAIAKGSDARALRVLIKCKSDIRDGRFMVLATLLNVQFKSNWQHFF